jgi:hypothetical protein
MTMGATTKSNPSANKNDDIELERLRKKDHWLVITRYKLFLDLIFVCQSPKAGLYLTIDLTSS